MRRVTIFQMYAALMIMTFPIAFLEVPKRQLVALSNNAWIPIVLSLLPGFLIFSMFLFIISRSQTPFPAMLEEHFGSVLGRVLQILYFLSELFIAAFGVRLFVEFIETNVMPGTPISVHISVLLFVSWLAIKFGWVTFIRTFEIMTMAGIAFTLVIFIIAFSHPLDIHNLLPIASLKLKEVLIATASTSVILSRGVIVLIFGKFMDDFNGLRKSVYWAMISQIMLLLLTVIVSILIFSGPTAQTLTFPTFSIVRIINIAGFIQNIDIIFIGIWILGIFGTTTGSWFIGLVSLQQALRLQDHRFLAAPTALIIGITSIVMSRNILEVSILSITIIPAFYGLVLVFIPFLMFLRVLFKPEIQSQPATTVPVQNMD